MSSINFLKIIIFFAGILIILSSCSNSTDGNYKPETKMIFYASTMDGFDTTYTIEANLVAFSDHAAVYVEDGENITSATAQNIINIFENDIYNNIRTYFAYESDVDNNGRIILLLLDIVDGFTGSGGYVAGYFDPYHIFDLNESNKADMIFLDIDPLTPGSDEFMDTIAHEFQHLVNFAENYLRGTGEQDTWINEGLSSAAEYLYKGEHKLSRLDYYNADPTGSISRGNNFFAWNDNIGTTDVLADYSTVYIFFQWLRIQASNGAGIYKDIMDNINKDYKAVEESTESRIYGGSDVEWFNILRDWYLAIGYSDPSGLYGFKGEFDYALGFHNITEDNTTVDLLPGEGVFDFIDSPFDPTEPENTHFIGIANFISSNRLDGIFDFETPYDGKVLLAWNGFESIEGTAITTPISMSSIVFTNPQASLSMSLSENSLPTSYPIGVSFPDPGSGRIKRDDE